MILRIPLFLSMYHLLIHLCLIVSILKILNREMIEMLNLKNGTSCKIFFVKPHRTRLLFFYFMDCNIYFIYKKPRGARQDLKCMCQIYDDLCTCVHLLQKCHGLETQNLWLEIIKGIQVYIWFGIECYVDDQIRQEVEKMDLLLIKNMIEFRCDPIRKDTLQLFKQIVNSNRLQFTACNLYRLSYATILGTIVSVITYSVISIQLF
ncbi:uncharacterized protein LOC128198454 [Bicyclus anynana]|uniref:Uncharacterized protein LOC128198454 n=1 Tax=Bicyclus anynana TaxID=110368 RepID=A0ABM3LLM7_BICAN|nr:uncharacterized protein LOC128198454 [Bicyclus anynana]